MAGTHGAVLSVNTGRWRIEVASVPFPNPTKNKGKALLDVTIKAEYDADHDVVAPHGLIGQSWDGDGVAMGGRRDDYRGTEVTTSAMAEGAIEGEPSDYEVSSAFDTDFKFSRFDATSATPRDVTKLSGVKGVGHKAGSAGASPDLSADISEEEEIAQLRREAA